MTGHRHHPEPAPSPDSMPELRRITGPVLAGVIPGQPPAVIRYATSLALSMGVELLCAFADVTTYLVEEEPDGSVESMPIDPDGIDDDAEDIATALRTRISSELDGSGVRWSFRSLAGEPAHALRHLAETAHASVIVVGTREPGIGHRLEELLTGSVAVHLAHHQHRPVLVVPLNPRPHAGDA